MLKGIKRMEETVSVIWKRERPRIQHVKLQKLGNTVRENCCTRLISWRQKSRRLLFKHGDKNTKFFHKKANAYKRYNHIDRLMIHGELIQGQGKNLQVLQLYQGLYSEA